MAFVSLEQKFRKGQEDNNELVSRWMNLKSVAADKLNEENDKVMKVKQLKLKKELEDASREFKEVRCSCAQGGWMYLWNTAASSHTRLLQDGRVNPELRYFRCTVI